MRYDWAEILVVSGFVLCLVLGVVAVVMITRAEEEFIAEHHCHATAETREQTWLQPIVSGKTTILIPHTDTDTLWVCADGERIWL